MIPVAAVAGIVLTVIAEGAWPTAAAAGFGIGGVGLYTVSAAAHYKVWDPATLDRLFQLDKSMIMVFILASTLPVGLAIGGGSGLALSVGMAIGVCLGLVALWAPFSPPRGFTNCVFFAVSWWPIFFVGQIGEALGSTGVAILLAGGLIYTVGALVVGFQRPNPNPEVFGYHEIWHIFVIVAHAVHFVLVALIVTGNVPL